MKYIVASNKSVPEAVSALEAAVVARQFGVLHIHNLHATLNGKGIPFEPQCQVLEVCNPQQAAKVLSEDMDMNMALPCRVSVYEKDGVTHIGTLLPSLMLSSLNDSEELAVVAQEVENVLIAAIDEAR
jgi:uncharacterized protein (DUF302 family)